MFKFSTILGTTQKAAATACAIATLAAIAPAANANQDPDVVAYANAGIWTVERVNDKGAFNYCRAGLKYESGIHVYMLGFQKGWMVQFFNEAWPKRKVSAFEGDLAIDGQTVETRAKSWRGNSVFLGLGTNVSSMSPLMRGKVMSVVTAAGQSNFSLKGSSLAIKLTAQCRAEGMAELNSQPTAQAPVTSNGAFGGRPQARPTATAPQAEPKEQRYKFNREQTLGHVKGYLGKTPHTIIAADKNTFKHFPVNWTTQSGIIGGMMIIANTSQTIDGGIKMLSGDNEKTCKGKAQVGEMFTTATPIGQKAIVTTTCETKAGLRIMTFSVIQRAPKTLMIVVEGYFQEAAPKTAGAQNPKLVGA